MKLIIKTINGPIDLAVSNINAANLAHLFVQFVTEHNHMKAVFLVHSYSDETSLNCLYL